MEQQDTVIVSIKNIILFYRQLKEKGKQIASLKKSQTIDREKQHQDIAQNKKNEEEISNQVKELKVVLCLSMKRSFLDGKKCLINILFRYTGFNHCCYFNLLFVGVIHLVRT